jgi:hypothetical protein
MTALLNPQKASGLYHSMLGSEPLRREFGDGLLAESERIEITGWIDPFIDNEERDKRAFRDRDPRAVIGFTYGNAASRPNRV